MWISEKDPIERLKAAEERIRMLECRISDLEKMCGLYITENFGKDGEGIEAGTTEYYRPVDINWVVAALCRAVGLRWFNGTEPQVRVYKPKRDRKKT